MERFPLLATQHAGSRSARILRTADDEPDNVTLVTVTLLHKVHAWHSK